MAPGTRRSEPYSGPSGGRSSVPLLSDSNDDRYHPGRDSRENIHHHHHHNHNHNHNDKRDRGRPVANGWRTSHPIHVHRDTLPSAANAATAAASARRSSMRSRSPSQLAAASARTKYTYAAIFLLLGLVSFCVQTELSAYIQGDLGWQKAYCMMFVTHSSWTLVWPLQLLVLRVHKWNVPWPVFWRRHLALLRSSAVMVEHQTLDVLGASRPAQRSVRYLLRTTALLTCSLTVAGLSWYIAVSMTNPSDLTAIYNCSAFFAYAFSVPILKEPLRLDKSLSVLVAIVGVLIVAYGGGDDDVGAPEGGKRTGPGSNPSSRFVGNMVIGVGSVLYGLYEVLYKRLACGPANMSTGRSIVFSNFIASCIGAFTLAILWVPLVLLDLSGLETFEIPDAPTCRLILVAVVANAIFSASFLILISLTSPVLSSVSALLTIFIIAVADWCITGQPLSSASMLGGGFIVCAFAALSWSTYREITEEAMDGKRAVDLADSDDSQHDD